MVLLFYQVAVVAFSLFPLLAILTLHHKGIDRRLVTGVGMRRIPGRTPGTEAGIELRSD